MTKLYEENCPMCLKNFVPLTLDRCCPDCRKACEMERRAMEMSEAKLLPLTTLNSTCAMRWRDQAD